MPCKPIVRRRIGFPALSYKWDYCQTRTVVESSKYFDPIEPALPEDEQAARAKRQQHAEWGLAVSRLGGVNIEPEMLHQLQCYINGELSLEELTRVDHPPGRPSQVYQVVAQREKFAG